MKDSGQKLNSKEEVDTANWNSTELDNLQSGPENCDSRVTDFESGPTPAIHVKDTTTANSGLRLRNGPTSSSISVASDLHELSSLSDSLAKKFGSSMTDSGSSDSNFDGGPRRRLVSHSNIFSDTAAEKPTRTVDKLGEWDLHTE